MSAECPWGWFSMSYRESSVPIRLKDPQRWAASYTLVKACKNLKQPIPVSKMEHKRTKAELYKDTLAGDVSAFTFTQCHSAGWFWHTTESQGMRSYLQLLPVHLSKEVTSEWLGCTILARQLMSLRGGQPKCLRGQNWQLSTTHLLAMKEGHSLQLWLIKGSWGCFLTED